MLVGKAQCANFDASLESLTASVASLKHQASVITFTCIESNNIRPILYALNPNTH